MFKTLEAEVLKNCTPLWREARLEVKMLNTTCSRHFWTLKRRFAWQAKRILHPAKNLIQSEQNVRVLYQFQKRWQAWDIWRRSAKMPFLHSRRNTRDTWVRYVRRSGRWFPERGCILEPQIFRFAKMILRDRCSTSYDLASLFRGKRNALDRWTGKIKKRIGTRLPALHSTFHCWRESRRSASFLMLSTWKFEEISQTRFVFDTVKFNKLWWYPQQPQRFIFTNLSEECCEAKRWETQTFSGPSPRPSPETLEPHLALHQSLPDLLRSLLQNPVEPDPAQHQNLPDLLRNLLWVPVELDLARHRNLPDLLRNLHWNLLRDPVEPDLALHQGFREPSPEPSAEPDLARHRSLPDLHRNLLRNLLQNPLNWLGFAPRLPGTFSGTFSGTLLNLTWPHQSLPNLFRTVSRTLWPGSPPNFSGTLLNLTWLCTKASQTFSGTFFRTLLNLTLLCTKASRNLLRNILRNSVENVTAPKPPRPSPEPFLGSLLNLTWLGTEASQTFTGTFSGTLLNLTWLCTKASQTFSGTFTGTFSGFLLSPDLALHQTLPVLLRNIFWNLLRNPVEPDLALHQGFREPSPEPCWTWPGSAPKPPRPSSEPSEPSVEPRWTWPGACTSAHRGSSGMKTPLAYAVGEKLRQSRRIAAVLMLSSWKVEDVWQNSFVFKLAGRQTNK